MKKKFIAGISLLVLAICMVSYGFKSTASVSKGESALIKWYTLEEAQRLSDSIPRKIFVDFTTSWCGWCKVMDQNTFSNPIIAKYMNEHFYCVRFDAETRDTATFNGQKFFNRGPVGQKSAHDFPITVLQGRLSYPSFAFISKDRKSFTIMQGYQPPEQFEPYIHYYGEDKELTLTWDEFMKTFKSELPKKEEPKKPIGPPQN